MRFGRTWVAMLMAARPHISRAAIGIAIGAMLVIWCFVFPGGAAFAKRLGLGGALHSAIVVSTVALAVWAVTFQRPSR